MNQIEKSEVGFLKGVAHISDHGSIQYRAKIIVFAKRSISTNVDSLINC